MSSSRAHAGLENRHVPSSHHDSEISDLVDIFKHWNPSTLIRIFNDFHGANTIKLDIFFFFMVLPWMKSPWFLPWHVARGTWHVDEVVSPTHYVVMWSSREKSGKLRRGEFFLVSFARSGRPRNSLNKYEVLSRWNWDTPTFLRSGKPWFSPWWNEDLDRWWLTWSIAHCCSLGMSTGFFRVSRNLASPKNLWFSNMFFKPWDKQWDKPWDKPPTFGAGFQPQKKALRSSD